MEKNRAHRKKWLHQIFLLGALLLAQRRHLHAAERIYTAYFSPAPGASAVIWVAKEARLFEKHGLDVAPVLIPSSVRTLQAILAGESAIAESAGPAVVSARLAGGDVVAIAGSVNILTYYFVTVPGIKRAEELKGKIGANQSPGTIADFALRVSLRKLGLDPAKDVSLRSIGVLYDRIAAMQKGIVQFTVLTEAEKPIVDKLGYPVLLDLISLRIPFPTTWHLYDGKDHKRTTGYGAPVYTGLCRGDPLFQNAKRGNHQNHEQIFARGRSKRARAYLVLVHAKHAGVSVSTAGGVPTSSCRKWRRPIQKRLH